MTQQSPLLRPADPRGQEPVEPNVLNVVLGNLLIRPWYPSFYPEELAGRKTERLYVCQWCFRYSRELIPFLAHMVGTPGFETTLIKQRTCAQRDELPPGRKTYERQDISIFEVDGEENKVGIALASSCC